MKVTYCDKCELPIKNGERKWLIGIKETTENKQEESDNISDIHSLINYYKKAQQQVEINEICPKCKKIYDGFFALNRQQVLKILNEIEKLEI